MLEDECVEISGLLVGLNVIDCNLGIKDEDLDQPVRDNHSLTDGTTLTFNSNFYCQSFLHLCVIPVLLGSSSMGQY